MKPRRRTILKVFSLLVAGATLNIAVAWGLAVWGLSMTAWNASEAATNTLQWQGTVPPEWPAPTMVGRNVGLGASHICTSGSMGSQFLGTWRLSTQDVYRTGLPMDSLQCEHRFTLRSGEIDKFEWFHATDPIHNQRLPLLPLWPGFAINTLFYAGVLWMLFCGPFALRRMIRRRRGRCPHCNYPIGQSPVCTECGAAVVPKVANA